MMEKQPKKPLTPAQEMDALDDRGRALSQEPLASTLSAKPSDLLVELKTKRSELSAALELYRARPDIHFFAFVPELARALDGMIAGVEWHRRTTDPRYPNHCHRCGEEMPCAALAAMARAYRGDDAKK